MANQFVSFTPYDEQMAELQRRQRLAELMQQQAMQPLETPQSGGRLIAKVSPLAGLAKMLQAYSAGAEARDIERQRGQAEERARGEAQDWFANLGTKQQPMSPDAALAASLSATPTETQRVPMSSSERTGQLMQGAMSANPYTSKLATMLLSQKPQQLIKEVEPDKFTPASLMKFQQSGNYADLEPVAEKPAAVPADIQGYNLAREQGFKGTFVDYQSALRRAGATNVTTSYGAPVAGVDAQGNPVFFQPSKEGGAPAIIPGVRPEAKPLTEGQATAAGFASRMASANDVFSNSPFKPSMKSETLSVMPFSNAFMSTEQQKIEQAKRNFITAQLRKESGASIAPSEFATAEKIYFPQVGDSPEVIEQKAATRRQAIAAMEAAAGKKRGQLPPGFVVQ